MGRNQMIWKARALFWLMKGHVLMIRFAGTHRDDDSCVVNGTINSHKKGNDFIGRGFSEAFWKNKVKFPKADASLKLLGLLGQASEWALMRRHSSEGFFGVKICGAYPDTVAKTVELIVKHCTVDFIDINMGCPIDINKGAGSALLTKPMRMKSVGEASSRAADTTVTIKECDRTGVFRFDLGGVRKVC